MRHSRSAEVACPSYRGIRRLSRRSVLKAGSLSALGISIAQYLALRTAQASNPARAKSVLLIYTMGGISHHDSFDPKPEATAEIRGEFKTIATKLPGIQFSDQVPMLAQMANRFTLIRSVHHRERDHGVGAYYMLRGYTQPNPAADRPENQHNTNPTIGSHVARLLDTPDGLPPYICVPALSYLAQINYYTAGWMGRSYDPFLLKSDPNAGDLKLRELAPVAEVSIERLRDRFNLLSTIDNERRRFEWFRSTRSFSGHYHRAYDILSSGRAQKAFDIATESDALRDAYGRNRLGQSCLLARRLIEAGVPFVTVDDDGWDHHAKIFPGLKKRLPEFDRCLSTLLNDLEERGLLDTTLVAALTDFGRTPVVNAAAGRDHWPDVFSVLLAGAGIPRGQVVGASDAIGGEPRSRPISPKDIAATIYDFLGLDPFQEYPGPDGRPLKMLDAGNVIQELL